MCIQFFESDATRYKDGYSSNYLATLPALAKNPIRSTSILSCMRSKSHKVGLISNNKQGLNSVEDGQKAKPQIKQTD